MATDQVDTVCHIAAIGQAAKQQLICQCAANGVLNQARHWASAHQRIKTLLGQISFELIAKGSFHFLLMQLVFQLHQEFIHYAYDDFL